MIRVKNLGKKFEQSWVLRDINLEIPDGEIVGLVGLNGAGKTTLLNIIAGVWLPSQGSVELNVATSELGYIPDTPFLYPRLSGREFLQFVGGLYKVSQQTINKRIEELEKVLELGFWLDKLTESYPKGLRQKINLAAMLLHSPRVFILDEPTANLDPKSASLFKGLLSEMASLGVSVLLSTHILEVAEKLCHRLVIIDQGKIIAEGTMQELRDIAKTQDLNLEKIFLKLTAKYAVG